MSTNMTLITSVTVGSGGAASVTLPATGTIPQTYTDLKMVYSVRATTAGTQNFIKVSFNGSTSSYSLRSLQGDGVAASSNAWNFQWIGYAVGSTATANTFSSGEMYVPNYTSSNVKSFSNDNVAELNGLNAQSLLAANLWSATPAAITTIQLTMEGGDSFVEGSTFYLYGISNVTSTTKATGGIVSSDGTYNYHMFPYSGTFTPTTTISADVLCIAGGGGGGRGDSVNSRGGAGGGAGGLRYLTSQSLTAQGYTVTIGAGGAGSTSTSAKGTNGGNSVFNTTTSDGGGGGGSISSVNGSNGGSGGGGAGGVPGGGTGGTATSGQGNNGGTGSTNGNAGAGGGGAGAAGSSTGGVDLAGAGGVGVNTYSSWATATQTGANNGYYAGGGGGATYTSGAIGGLGGGGVGGNFNNESGGTGIANTGAGGGGSANANGASGGSGLVIIRYAI